jgi:hypothetical protein
VNINEAKNILIIYRTGPADADDPQVAEALSMAANDPELGRWLETQKAQQEALRSKFRGIAVPAGLKEQIISEHAAGKRMAALPRKIWYALAAALVILGMLALYQNAMVRTALGGYPMDVMTNDLAPVRAYLATKQAPANFTMPAPLQHARLIGCAARVWQGANVSLVCFRTGRPLAHGDSNDLWLFVTDRSAVKNAPDSTTPQFAKVNRLMTATWAEGDKLYFLAVEGEEADLKSYL